MIKKKASWLSALLATFVCCLLITPTSFAAPATPAANLLEVFQQAQASDPIFLQAISQRFSTQEGVPISAAALLPNIQFVATPSISRTGYAGSNFVPVITTVQGVFLNPRNLDR